MRKIISIIIVLMALVQPVCCFATDADDVEKFLSPFQPKARVGHTFEEFCEIYKLVEVKNERGGIIDFDVAENGNIAVITGERRYLTIYDPDMNIIGQYEPKYQMEGVRYLGDKLLVFNILDRCVVYDENREYVASYEIEPEPHETYERIARENPKKRGEFTYYKSDRIKKIPTLRLGRKHQSMYLVRVDKDGKRTVLLNRALYKLMWTLVAALIIIVNGTLGLLYLSDKYPIFETMRKKFERVKKQKRY